MQSNMNNAVYRRRRLVSRFNLAMAWLTMAFGLFWLGWIFYTLFYEGFSGLGTHIFTLDTPPPGMEGGLRNAILGSLMITLFGLLIGTPIGILCGIFLAEFGQRSKLAAATRFMNDILLSAPSIVIGLFIYELVVVQQGHFSGWAGSLALSLLVIPVVVRTTDEMLQLQPSTMREAALALGVPQWKLTLQIVLRAAKAGVVTGILLALARISGETAPLLFTAFGNEFFSLDPTGAMSAVPLVMYKFAGSGYENWERLAWAGALLVTLFVLATSLGARAILLRNKPAHD